MFLKGSWICVKQCFSGVRLAIIVPRQFLSLEPIVLNVPFVGGAEGPLAKFGLSVRDGILARMLQYQGAGRDAGEPAKFDAREVGFAVPVRMA